MYLLEINLEYRVFIGISAMVVLFGSFFIVFVNSQRKKLQYHKNLQTIHQEQQKNLTDQNLLLEQRVSDRTIELLHQKEALQRSLQELNATQAQLVQREKMASLGELTAGIAHEIQNPLNFVNNFSEINKDLILELQKELRAGNAQDALAISNEMKENEEKIHNHGRRADSIVKNMLQHSRGHTGQKEPTNINTLEEEYLRLAYHGYRGKDKDFNAVLQTNYDKAVGELEIIPQDIGRVLLNLLNNAFHTVSLKKSTSTTDYEPVIVVTTKKLKDKVEISVQDNGGGIPQNAFDKIFQPFYTTKPSGQGTGLGLSLSYDIVKAHGGEIQVESKQGEGSTFIIQLPLHHNIAKVTP